MRNTSFVNDEFYHIYNRGTDKRNIFSDRDDINRFFQSMNEFNAIEPIGSIYENSFRSQQLGSSASKLEVMDKKLVSFICYCLNPNHYHFIVEQITERGIEKLLHRIGTGYTKYFNNKNERSGSLFQGKFKAIHIDSNEYLLHLSSYVNLNNRVHKLNGQFFKSSLDEYRTETGVIFCKKDIILDQFKSTKKYQKFTENSLSFILKNRAQEDFVSLLLE